MWLKEFQRSLSPDFSLPRASLRSKSDTHRTEPVEYTGKLSVVLEGNTVSEFEDHHTQTPLKESNNTMGKHFSKKTSKTQEPQGSGHLTSAIDVQRNGAYTKCFAFHGVPRVQLEKKNALK